MTVVTVTYNEADNIGRLLHEIRDVSRKHQLRTEAIVVDDNSPDGTAFNVAAIVREDSDVVLVTRSTRAGIGSAYLAGLQQARGRCVVTMDADLSHPPAALGAMVEKARIGYVVSGSRFLEGSVFTSPVWRKSATRILNLFAMRWLGLDLRDYTNGYLALRHQDLERILDAGAALGIYPFRYTLYGVAIFSLAWRLGIPIAEVAAPYRFREFGESKIKTLAGIRLFFETLVLIFRCGRAIHHP